jgi:hypothetical protein
MRNESGPVAPASSSGDDTGGQSSFTLSNLT